MSQHCSNQAFILTSGETPHALEAESSENDEFVVQAEEKKKRISSHRERSVCNRLIMHILNSFYCVFCGISLAL